MGKGDLKLREGVIAKGPRRVEQYFTMHVPLLMLQLMHDS